MNVVEATHSYERWLAARIRLVPADLELKHRRMRESAPGFLRATYYRWAQRFPAVVPELAAAPVVLAVGDLHIENFGTWRDREGRLAWGVNDYDQIERLPYANDLVRLAASALVATDEERLELRGGEACGLLLDGYGQGLAGGAGAAAPPRRRLERALRKGGSSEAEWWERLHALPPFVGTLPAPAAGLLRAAAPVPGWSHVLYARVAGLGSLGHRRVVAAGRGGEDDAPEARELKQLVAPAGAWLGRPGVAIVAQGRLGAAGDPSLHRRSGWQVRRLAPDCHKLDLADYGERLEREIMRSMGYETARAHLALGARGAAIVAVAAHLERLSARDLHEAAAAMAQDVQCDHRDWRDQPGAAVAGRA